MKLLFIWLLMTAFFLGTHAFIWRKKKEWQNKKNLLIILFLVFLSIGLFDLGFLQCLQLSLAYFSFGFSYFIFYLWLEGDSPSLRFIEVLNKKSPEPTALAILETHFSEKNPVTGRLQFLVEDGFCVHSPPNYQLTRKGNWLARGSLCISHFFNIRVEG